MYAPDTVTVYKREAEGLSATVLRGVFLEPRPGAEAEKSGMKGQSAARLFIPYAVKAEDAFTGAEREYVSPREYSAMADKSGFWTLDTAAGDCWFVKGESRERAEYGELRERRDGVFRVAAVAERDYGYMELRHIEVSAV